jgi:hypothetical protein
MSRKQWLVTILLGMTLVGVGGIFMLKHTTNPIPKHVQSAVNFPLYYPAQLPPGWRIDTTSFSVASDVVLYRVVNANDPSKGASISIQPQQDGLDIDQFYKKNLAKSTQFTTPLGQAAIGQSELNTRVGSIVTGDSWILITAPLTNASTSDIRTIITNLKH